MKITIAQAKQYLLKNKNIELFSVTRFLNVKLDKKLSLNEAIVGVNGSVIYIVYKKWNGFEHYALKKDIEFTREFQSYTPIRLLLNQKTIQIQLKKNLKLLKKTYIVKKTLHYSKYAALLVGVPVAGNIAYDLLLDYVTNQIKEVAANTIIENADTIASKTADSLVNKLNPFT